MGRNNQRRKTRKMKRSVGGSSFDLSSPERNDDPKTFAPVRDFEGKSVDRSLYINRLIQKHIEDLNDITGLEIGLEGKNQQQLSDDQKKTVDDAKKILAEEKQLGNRSTASRDLVRKLTHEMEQYNAALDARAGRSSPVTVSDPPSSASSPSSHSSSSHSSSSSESVSQRQADARNKHTARHQRARESNGGKRKRTRKGKKSRRKARKGKQSRRKGRKRRRRRTKKH